MLNTKKLLYILPDVAYSAELLPGKKPFTFTISSFRQINGEYMDDNEFIAGNILKLFNKIDPEEYQLILPDFLFTNTIINVKEKSDAKIKEYLNKKLLPELNISTSSHQIDTTVLNEHDGTTRIQLSALEKSLLEPLQISAKKSKVKIKSISPLSWSIKSIVSLEPSISVVQIDSMLYVALQYIGVDQSSQATVEKVENIYETIKTLKGAEPSIQTIYLISNELVEDKLKEHLSDTLPIQQLAGKQNEDSKMPSYVGKIIESGMRTLSISDYPVPKFNIGEAPKGATIKDQVNSVDKAEVVKEVDKKDTPTEETSLPKPQKTVAEEEVDKTPPKEEETEEAKKAEEEISSEKEAPVTTPKVAPPTPIVAKTEKEGSSEEVAPTTPVITKTEKEESSEDDEIEALLEGLKNDEEEEKEIVIDNKKSEKQTNVKKEAISEKPVPEKTKVVIKNKDKTKTMLKMVFVTLAVFFATVAIGVGIGLGVLQITQPSSDEPVSPVAEIVESPTPSPSPSPSPELEVETANLSVLVVNATTKAGYAGEIADELTDFETIKAGNAKGDYESGLYILMTDENEALTALIETATELKYTFQEKDSTEDPQDKYDVVIVLAE